MMNRVLSILEILVGISLVVCFFFDGNDTVIKGVIGFDLNIVNGVIIVGSFYVLKTLYNLIMEMAEPTSASFARKFLMFFQILTGFTLIITGLCDGRDSIIEKFFEVEIIANHGAVVLGVYYASRSVAQLFFEESGSSIADV